MPIFCTSVVSPVFCVKLVSPASIFISKSAPALSCSILILPSEVIEAWSPMELICELIELIKSSLSLEPSWILTSTESMSKAAPLPDSSTAFVEILKEPPEKVPS